MSLHSFLHSPRVGVEAATQETPTSNNNVAIAFLMISARCCLLFVLCDQLCYYLRETITWLLDWWAAKIRWSRHTSVYCSTRMLYELLGRRERRLLSYYLTSRGEKLRSQYHTSLIRPVLVSGLKRRNWAGLCKKVDHTNSKFCTYLSAHLRVTPVLKLNRLFWVPRHRSIINGTCLTVDIDTVHTVYFK